MILHDDTSEAERRLFEVEEEDSNELKEYEACISKRFIEGDGRVRLMRLAKLFNREIAPKAVLDEEMSSLFLESEHHFNKKQEDNAGLYKLDVDESLIQNLFD